MIWIIFETLFEIIWNIAKKLRTQKKYFLSAVVALISFVALYISFWRV